MRSFTRYRRSIRWISLAKRLSRWLGKPHSVAKRHPQPHSEQAMQTIRHLNIEITKNCNQRCLYCFNDSGPTPAMRSIAVSDWKRYLEGQIRHGLQSIHITGGEPFVDRNTLALLADAQRLGFGTSVLSNGFKIPELVTKYPQLFRELAGARGGRGAGD